MKVEIKPYGKGTKGWAIWIDDEWVVGNEEAMIDANTACHILVLRMQKLGINATYKMVVPPERMYKTQKPSKGFWSWLLSKREIP